MQTIAKIQAANTWELATVPYIPAVKNAAQHAANLREAGNDGLMLGWTLGGYPSPNLEAVAVTNATPTEALQRVALRRFGPQFAPSVVKAWSSFSTAFGEYPYHIGVAYQGPQEYGPANLLWEKPTGYRATMVGFPYDDLQGWRAIYPPEIFAAQFEKMAEGFAPGIETLRASLAVAKGGYKAALISEINVAQACALHFRSTANQVRFVMARDALSAAKTSTEAKGELDILERLLRDEIALAKQLHEIQVRDSRLGFEASNQYFYVPIDLAEKVINCHDLQQRWLPAERAKWQK